MELVRHLEISIEAFEAGQVDILSGLPKIYIAEGSVRKEEEEPRIFLEQFRRIFLELTQ